MKTIICFLLILTQKLKSNEFLFKFQPSLALSVFLHITENLFEHEEQLKTLFEQNFFSQSKSFNLDTFFNEVQKNTIAKIYKFITGKKLIHLSDCSKNFDEICNITFVPDENIDDIENIFNKNIILHLRTIRACVLRIKKILEIIQTICSVTNFDKFMQQIKKNFAILKNLSKKINDEIKKINDNMDLLFKQKENTEDKAKVKICFHSDGSIKQIIAVNADMSKEEASFYACESAKSTFFDAEGLKEKEIIYHINRTQNQTFFNPDESIKETKFVVFHWNKNDELLEIQTIFNADELKTGKVFLYPNNSQKQVIFYPNGSIQEIITFNSDQSIKKIVFNENKSKIIEKVFFNPDGSEKKIVFNADGSRTQTLFRSNGSKEKEVVIKADKSKILTFFHLNGPIEKTLIYFKANGSKEMKVVFNNDGSQMQIFFRPDGSKEKEVVFKEDGSEMQTFFRPDGSKEKEAVLKENGSQIQTFFRQDGSKEKEVVFKENKSQIYTIFNANGSKNIEITFNADKIKIKEIIHYVDGSTLEKHFNANGEKKQSKLFLCPRKKRVQFCF